MKGIGSAMAERMKRSLQRIFWRMCWLLAATTLLFFAVAEFARQYQAERAAASSGAVIDESTGFGQDAALGLACLALVCLLLGLRKRHHLENS